jgi:hypothetical protein
MVDVWEGLGLGGNVDVEVEDGATIFAMLEEGQWLS